MLSINEKKVIENLEKIENKLRNSFYNILNLLSIKSEEYNENYNLYKFSIKPKKEVITDINMNIIITNFEKYKNSHFNELQSFNNFLNKLDSLYNPKKNDFIIIFNNLEEMYKFYNTQKKIFLLSKFYHELLNRSDLFKIMMKDIINSKEDLIIRNILISERFRGFILKTSYQVKKDKLKLNQIKELLTKSIKDIFNELKIKKENKPIILKNIQIYKYLKLEFKYIEHQLLVNIILPIFNILLKLPFNKKYDLKKFTFFLLIFGNEGNEYELNYRYFNSDKKNTKKLLLYKKIESLFKKRIVSIAEIVLKEKRMENNNININTGITNNEYLIDILQKFMDYTSDYYKLFKIKCNLCQKNVKYSYIEKCFYPPYYKIYSEREISNLRNNEKTENLFVHEECFKKMALPSL